MLATLPTLLPMVPMVPTLTPMAPGTWARGLLMLSLRLMPLCSMAPMATLAPPVPMGPTLMPTPTWDKGPVHLPPYSCRTPYLFIQHVQQDRRQPMIVIRVSSSQPVTKRSSAPPTEAAGDTRGTRVIYIIHFLANKVVDV